MKHWYACPRCIRLMKATRISISISLNQTWPSNQGSLLHSAWHQVNLILTLHLPKPSIHQCREMKLSSTCTCQMLANDKCFKLHYDETRWTQERDALGTVWQGHFSCGFLVGVRVDLFIASPSTNTHPQSIGKDVFCIISSKTHTHSFSTPIHLPKEPRAICHPFHLRSNTIDRAVLWRGIGRSGFLSPPFPPSTEITTVFRPEIWFVSCAVVVARSNLSHTPLATLQKSEVVNTRIFCFKVIARIVRMAWVAWVDFLAATATNWLVGIFRTRYYSRLDIGLTFFFLLCVFYWPLPTSCEFNRKIIHIPLARRTHLKRK